MSDETKNLEFKISTPYDGKGAKAAADDLSGLSQAAEKASVSHEHLGTTSEDVEQRLGGLTNEARETRKAFMELNRIFPGVGDAMMGLSGDGSDLLLGVAALAAGVQIALDAFRSYSKAVHEADEAGQIFQKGIVLDAVKALASAWSDVAKAQEVFYLTQGRDQAIAAIEAQTSAVKKAARDQLSELEQQKEAAIAAIQDQEAQGVISHKEALAEKLKLDRQYEQDRAAIDRQAKAQEEAVKQKQIEQLKTLRAGAEIGERRTAVDAGQAEAASKANAARVKEFEDAQKEGQETAAKSGVTPELVEKMREAYETIYAGGGAGSSAAPNKIGLQDMARFFQKNASFPFLGTAAMMKFGVGAGDAEDINEAFRDVDGAGLTPYNFARYESGTAESATAKGGIKHFQDRQGQLDERSAVMALEHERDQKRIEDLNAEIERLQGPGGAPASTGGAVAPSHNVPGTRQTPIQEATSDYAQMQAAGDLIAKGGQLNDSQGQLISAIYQMMTGHVGTNDKIVQFLQTLRTSQEARDAAFDRELALLNQRVSRAQNAADNHF